MGPLSATLFCLSGQPVHRVHYVHYGKKRAVVTIKKCGADAPPPAVQRYHRGLSGPLNTSRLCQATYVEFAAYSGSTGGRTGLP